MNINRRDALKAAGVALAACSGGWLLGRAKAASPAFIRPPGTRGERHFLAACIRCNQCVAACPGGVLRLADEASGVAFATPYLVPRSQPCDLCLGRGPMRCIAACPTAALQPVSRPAVRMGVAQIDEEACLSFLGVSCRACWHACPFPDVAIRFDQQDHPVVIAGGCVGCGLCEYKCLAQRAAIVVRPDPVGRPSPVVRPTPRSSSSSGDVSP